MWGGEVEDLVMLGIIHWFQIDERDVPVRIWQMAKENERDQEPIRS
jgi:hypothetical protein